jgi:Fe2+ or Zn2+ uptake regulation protein
VLLQLNQEQVYNEVKRLKESGLLHQLVQVGLLSSKTLLYMEICEEMEIRKRRFKYSSNKIIINQIADKFKCSDSTIYRAIAIMKLPISNSQYCDK